MRGLVSVLSVPRAHAARVSPFCKINQPKHSAMRAYHKRISLSTDKCKQPDRAMSVALWLLLWGLRVLCHIQSLADNPIPLYPYTPIAYKTP